MKLYRYAHGAIVEREGRWHRVEEPWDVLMASEGLAEALAPALRGPAVSAPSGRPLAPLGSAQEVWAAGVTYLRSREARMEESSAAGGADCYRKVYDAARPELFFKSTPSRCSGPGDPVRIRADATWNVPEPELALLLSPRGRILGYTIGNDMSSRDIEGENPLYLPQAKVYDQSCALGPCVLVGEDALPVGAGIRVGIARGGATLFTGETSVSRIKRPLRELAAWLYRDNSFPHGCVLLTGTGIVPPDGVTLQPDDRVSIAIDGIGALENHVVRAAQASGARA
jgi:2-dehydro-3-deoxy-D-arabinonate dehydratase